MALAAASRKQQGGGQGPGSPGYDNLDPSLRAIADRIVAESGGRVWIGSGWRSTQQQAAMYNAWRNGTYDVPRVAAPGRSQHNHGRAIDFGGDLRLAQQLGRRYGLIFPMSDEPWHGQLGEGQSYSNEPDWSGMGVQYNLNYTGTGRAASPQEVIANRMSAIMSSLGGNEFGSGAMDSMPQDDPFSIGQPGMGLDVPVAKAGGLVERPTMKTGGRAGEKNWETGKSGQMASDLSRGRPFMVGNISGNARNPQVSFSPTGDRNQLGSYAKSLFAQFGFDEADYPALVELWNRESGDPRAGSSQVTWNPMAQNPTSSAFGIAQFLNGTWRATGIQKTTNPQQQILAGLMYIRSRYGSPSNALMFHNRHNWY